MNSSFPSHRPKGLPVSTENAQSLGPKHDIGSPRTPLKSRPSPGEIDRRACERIARHKISSAIDEARAHQAWMAYFAAQSAHTAYAFKSAIGQLLSALAMIEDAALAERLIREQLDECPAEFREDYQNRVASCFQPTLETDAPESHDSRAVPTQSTVSPAGNGDLRSKSSSSLSLWVYGATAATIACVCLTFLTQFVRHVTDSFARREGLTTHLLKNYPSAISHEQNKREELSDKPVIVNSPQQDQRTTPPLPEEINRRSKRQEVPNYAVQLQKAMEADSGPVPKAPPTPIPATQLTVGDFKTFGNDVFPPMLRRQFQEPEKPMGNNELFKIISNTNTTIRTEDVVSMTEQHYAEKLASEESTSGPTSSATAKCLGEFADFYVRQRRFQAAAPLCVRRLAILKSVLSTDGNEFRECTLQWARIHLGAKQSERVTGMLESSLAAFEEELGPDHPDTVTCRECLATAYLQQSAFAKADDHFRKVLMVQQTLLGADDSAIAESCDNIGTVSLATGNIPGARFCFERGLRIRAAAISTDDAELARSHNNLGLVCVAEQSYDLANKHFTSSKNIVERVFGRNDILTAAAYTNLAKLQFIRGKYQDASTLLLKVQLIYQNTYGPMHADTLAVEQLLLESTNLADQTELEKATGN